MTLLYIIGFLLVVGSIACFTLAIHINRSYESFQKICENEIRLIKDELHNLEQKKFDLEKDLKKIKKTFAQIDENNKSDTKNT